MSDARVQLAVNGTLMRVDGGMSCGTPMVPVVRNFLLPQASI